NPLEPALFSKPIIFGTHMDDFKEVSDTLLSNKAAFMVKDRDELLETVTMLLNNEELTKETGQNAGGLVVKGRGAVDKILSVIFQSGFIL
ncbi:MAG: 3-deoxy-D-manno-octulosonic acid transferase, partial [Desulfamplus sp.]|nr:3-deoxy-D-manno-octulosonic acid transferase [Desulfamplus sp.]